MHRSLLTLVIAALGMTAAAQGPVSLDSCRAMALKNNKEIKKADLGIEKAGYNRLEAAAAYKPSIDFEASYMYNQKQLALIGQDQMLPTKSFNLQTQSYEYNLVTNPVTGEPLVVNGQPVPSTVALLPKSGLTYNIHNIFAGALTVTQPIYMGGKITAMNEITRYAEELAHSMRDSKAQDIIYNVDVAYWQVVSLKAKQRLAESFVKLVESFEGDVQTMIKNGVATKANLLTVDVKLNEANIALTKVNNGLTLSRMALSQLCGTPINQPLSLVDEDKETLENTTLRPTTFNMDDIYSKRRDLHSLELATKIYDQKAKVVRSEMKPQVVALAAYHATNPNTYNGFENKFGFAFSIGAMVKIPLWHWGGLTNKYKAAQVEAREKTMELEDAREKVQLQVSQASFRYEEAYKTYNMTCKNLEKANENLRIAQVGFHEGVATTDEVLTAQTAWLQAQSEKIDAEIDVRLCDVYLSKVMGELKY
ncbi:MAG: TolC family protein [Bacteroidales bacterium]|nr:TolC family protein [Candidatus Sodaliphilus aphodohippi]